MQPQPDQVIETGRRFGLDISSEEADELAKTTADFTAALDVFEPDHPADEPVGRVSEGVDPHNAFLYEFRLDTADGALSDLRIGVKDNLAVSGVPMTCGSAGLEFTPPYHATVVRRLADGGATIVGTTNMDDFAYFVTGETCAHGRIANPRVEDSVPGGSSAGSGAAVAAGLAEAALGSDTGGSVRIPASWCGVIGFKPTHGLVSRFGLADLSPSLDHVGVLARSVETASRILDSVEGPDPLDPSTYALEMGPSTAAAVNEGVDGLSLGLVEESFTISDPAVAQRVESSARALESVGADIQRVSLSGYEEAGEAVEVICGAEFVNLMANRGQVPATGTGYSDEWRRAIQRLVNRGAFGRNVSEQLVINNRLWDETKGRAYVAAQNARSDFLEGVIEAFDAFDGLITPTTPMTAPRFGQIDSVEDFLRTVANTAPFNLTGHPALSVPCGEVDGKPVGLQVVANWNAEPVAAAIGAASRRD